MSKELWESVNYELDIRGKNHLPTASKKLVLNKSIDYVQALTYDHLRKFHRPAKEIDELRMLWKYKMESQRSKSYSNHEKKKL